MGRAHGRVRRRAKAAAAKATAIAIANGIVRTKPKASTDKPRRHLRAATRVLQRLKVSFWRPLRWVTSSSAPTAAPTPSAPPAGAAGGATPWRGTSPAAPSGPASPARDIERMYPAGDSTNPQHSPPHQEQIT
jgi:hypothetical protein